MTLTSLTDLAPEPRAALDRYLAAVDAATRRIDADAADAIAEDLREHALATLNESATVADVDSLVAELGTPQTFAAGLGDSALGDSAIERDASAPQGRLLGIPYDLRPPTAARISARWWNPAEPRIIMPRIFGMGWTVNFGAVAVRLGLIEPDAEDVPFASVPSPTFLSALLVPVALTALIAGSFLALRPVLPALLPSHWGISGQPDAFTAQLTVFGGLLALSAVPTLAALWAVAANRPRPTRAVLIGAATFFTALAAGIWALTVATVFGAGLTWALPILLLVALPFGAVLGVFVGLARAGRGAERRRDLGHESEVGR